MADLETLETKYDEEDFGLILFLSLLSSYMKLRDIILYSCHIFTIDKVYDALLSQEKMKHLVVRSEGQVEDLVVLGRTQDRNLGNNVRTYRSLNIKTKYHFWRKGHIKTDYSKLQKMNRMATAK